VSTVIGAPTIERLNEDCAEAAAAKPAIAAIAIVFISLSPDEIYLSA
jgi:hypothetical protein